VGPFALAICLGERKSPSSASDFRETLVESLSEVRTKRAGFFSILPLEVHPELGIRPILIGAGAQVLLNIGAGEEVPIASLK